MGDAPPIPEQPNRVDADLYKVTLRAGELLDVTMAATSGTLEPLLAVVDANGNEVAFSWDFAKTISLSYTARSAGVYYVVATGWTIIDLDTGQVTRPQGDYRIDITARAGDRDLYAVTLQAGDVLGLNLRGRASYVSVFEPTGTEVHGSPYDASSAYPGDNPLPGGGTAVTDHVARSAGLHYVEVTSGDGGYQAEFEVYRYGGAAKKQTQTIFLDANGQRLNTNIFGGRGVTTLSRLSKFLGRWGLPASAERAVVDQIKATVRENIESDLKAFGISRYVDVRVVSNYDTRDPFGTAGVSRVVVGGTIEESGVPTIGVAQSIDPGNFEREESALVLLDALSEPANAEDPAPYSLNTYMNARSNRIAFVGRAIGNVVSHEIGHYIGNWHTDEQNTRVNLMDAGGVYAPMFGVGPDGVGGTRDDTDVDFGRDRFTPWEGFTGIEDTMARSAWGLSSRP
jgi:hypothetical protein